MHSIGAEIRTTLPTLLPAFGGETLASRVGYIIAAAFSFSSEERSPKSPETRCHYGRHGRPDEKLDGFQES